MTVERFARLRIRRESCQPLELLVHQVEVVLIGVPTAREPGHKACAEIHVLLNGFPAWQHLLESSQKRLKISLVHCIFKPLLDRIVSFLYFLL